MVMVLFIDHSRLERLSGAGTGEISNHKNKAICEKELAEANRNVINMNYLYTGNY